MPDKICNVHTAGLHLSVQQAVYIQKWKRLLEIFLNPPLRSLFWQLQLRREQSGNTIRLPTYLWFSSLIYLFIPSPLLPSWKRVFQVAAAIGGGKTPEQCFNRWYAKYNRQVASEQQQAQGGCYNSSGEPQLTQRSPVKRSPLGNVFQHYRAVPPK